MNTAIWITNKYTNHSSVIIQQPDNDIPIQIDLFGNTIEDHLNALADLIPIYNLTTIKASKDYLIFQPMINNYLRQTYKYADIKMEEM